MSIIGSNRNAQSAFSALRINERQLAQSMQQLSTGKRINAAKHDAAGLAISTRMTAELRGMSMAVKNANDGISMMQTAEGALGEVNNMLQRMRELSVQAATGSVTADNRKALRKEMDQLIAEIDNVAKKTNFNGINLLDGTAKGVRIQTNFSEGDQVTVDVAAATSSSLGLRGFRVEGQVTSGRVGEVSALARDDVLFNGKAALGRLADGDSAQDLAEAINSNIGEHRVQARAFNLVLGASVTGRTFEAGALEIAVGTDGPKEIGAAGSLEELVSNINRDASGITATLGSDGAIELSNDTGKTITIGGRAVASTGLSAGIHKGFVELTSLDNESISIEAKRAGNGYPIGDGTLADVQAMGLNESTAEGGWIGGQVTSSAIDASDDLRINHVRIGPSVDGSALSKASAINLMADQTGVRASAQTVALVSVDLSGGEDASGAQSIGWPLERIKTLNTDYVLLFSDGSRNFSVQQTGDLLADVSALITTINAGVNDYHAAFVGNDLVITSNSATGELGGNFALAYDSVLRITGGTEVQRIDSVDNDPGADGQAQVVSFATSERLNLNSFGLFSTLTNGDKIITIEQTGDLGHDLKRLRDEAAGALDPFGLMASFETGGDFKLVAQVAGVPIADQWTLYLDDPLPGYMGGERLIGETTTENIVPSDAVAELDTYFFDSGTVLPDRYLSMTDGSRTFTIKQTGVLTNDLNALVEQIERSDNTYTASVIGDRLALTAKLPGIPLPQTRVMYNQELLGFDTGPLVEFTTTESSSGGATDPRLISINGQSIDLSSARSLEEVISAINETRVNGVIASADPQGVLRLSSGVGADITIVDSARAFIRSVSSETGEAGSGRVDAEGVTVRGRISLIAPSEEAIRIESISAGAAAKLGLAEQGGLDAPAGAMSTRNSLAAGRAITQIDRAIERVSLERANLGAFQNRLTAAVDNLNSTMTKLSESRSRIVDADYAAVTIELARNQIVQQAATAMLAQANQQPRTVLALLR